MSYVIFSIDNAKNPLVRNQFQNHMKQAQGHLVPVLGCYEGERENAFICSLDDFDRLVRPTAFIAEQESILHVASGNKQETTLEYLEGSRSAPPGTQEFLGSMHAVCEAEAMQAPSWTYRPDLNAYWIAKKGNPDGSYRRSVEEYSTVTAVAAE